MNRPISFWCASLCFGMSLTSLVGCISPGGSTTQFVAYVDTSLVIDVLTQESWNGEECQELIDNSVEGCPPTLTESPAKMVLDGNYLSWKPDHNQVGHHRVTVVYPSGCNLVGGRNYVSYDIAVKDPSPVEEDTEIVHDLEKPGSIPCE